tara:strand:- start:1543 stop:1794 length:252 start_codon:yes stop_codon:yes gene_type:complete
VTAIHLNFYFKWVKVQDQSKIELRGPSLPGHQKLGSPLNFRARTINAYELLLGAGKQTLKLPCDFFTKLCGTNILVGLLSLFF